MGLPVDKLTSLQIFRRVAEARSFTAAARRLGLPLSIVKVDRRFQPAKARAFIDQLTAAFRRGEAA